MISNTPSLSDYLLKETISKKELSFCKKVIKKQDGKTYVIKFNRAVLSDLDNDCEPNNVKIFFLSINDTFLNYLKNIKKNKVH